MGADKPGGRNGGIKPGKSPVRARPTQPETMPPQESYARLKATLDALPDLLFVLDRAGRIVDYHAPNPDRLYKPPEQFLGRTMNEVLPEPAAGIVDRAIADARARGHHQGSVYPLPTPDGNRWFEISVASQGDLRTDAGRLVAIARDITHRKWAEDALRRSEARFAQNARQTRTFVWEVDRDGLYMYVSPVVEDVLGYRPDEIAGRLHFYDLHPEEGREAFKTSTIQTVRAGGDFRNFENPMVAKDGRLVWVSTNAFPLQDTEGSLCGYWGSDMDITARKRVQEELRESEARFAAAIQASRSFVWEVAPDGLYVHVDDMVTAILGYSPEEMVGRMHFYDLLPADEREEMKQACFKIMARRESPSGFENANMTKDGRIVWVSSSARPLFNADGTYRGYQGIDTDITARILAEEALKHSESKYRRLLEEMREAFVLADMEGRLVECNPAFEALVGYRRDEIARLHYADITPAKWRQIDARAIKRVLRHGSSDMTEKEYVRKDGTVVPVEMSGTLIRDMSGKPVGISAIIRDISERKRSEQALQAAHDELEQRVAERTAELVASQRNLAASEEQFRQMAESIPEVFWLLDLKTSRVLYVSPAFETLWGRPRDSLADGFADWLATLHPDDQAGVARDFKRGARTGTFTPMEYRIVRPDGSLRWIRDSAWGIRDARGRIVRVAGVFRDITDRRRMEEEILQAAETERQRIGRDLHDSLGQSLTAIGYLAAALRENLARAKRPETADVRKLGRLIEKTAEHSHALARGLLLADLKRGGLAAALQELASRTQELFGIACRYSGPATLPLVDANVAGQFYRIAQEAATNAAKHSQGRRIEIRLTKRRGDLQVSVRDYGKGISPKKRKGFDLGLDIMRYRAGMIGATLEIDSRRNRGTTVRCRLPLSAPQEGNNP